MNEAIKTTNFNERGLLWLVRVKRKNKSYRDLLIFEYMQTEREFLQGAKQELIKVLGKDER